jgi:hypothetical protein
MAFSLCFSIYVNLWRTHRVRDSFCVCVRAHARTRQLSRVRGRDSLA